MIITGTYPKLRLRRSRKFDWSRRLVQENNLSFNDLDIVKYQKNETEHSIILNINVVNSDQLDLIVNKLEKEYNFINISFFESKQLY